MDSRGIRNRVPDRSTGSAPGRSGSEPSGGAVAVDVLQPLCKAQGGGKQVKPFSTKLLEALVPHLRHRHAALRLSLIHI